MFPLLQAVVALRMKVPIALSKNFDQSLSEFRTDQTTRYTVMAQQQLDHLPQLEIANMYSLSDNIDRREKTLPGGSLGISFVSG